MLRLDRLHPIDDVGGFTFLVRMGCGSPPTRTLSPLTVKPYETGYVDGDHYVHASSLPNASSHCHGLVVGGCWLLLAAAGGCSQEECLSAPSMFCQCLSQIEPFSLSFIYPPTSFSRLSAVQGTMIVSQRIVRFLHGLRT